MGEENGSIGQVKAFAIMVKSDFVDAWDSTRPAEPSVPLHRELIEDWRHGIEMTFSRDTSIDLEDLVSLGIWSAFTFQSSVRERLFGFRERRHAILSFLIARGEEHIEQITDS